ncbi:prephenate dehydratase, partial [bacterium]|nr:prephenate dehydratase [bacterium]
MDIDKLRKIIDEVDVKILDLLNQRAETAMAIGKEKQKRRLKTHDKLREEKVIKELVLTNKGPLLKKMIATIYHEILSACRSLQSSVKVAYFGPKASNTYLAARKRFGSFVDFVPVSTISDVFREVEKDKADFGLVPVENSTEGMVSYTLDMFFNSKLKISGEISLPITHNLLAKGSKEEIKRVYSNPQALAQCRTWISNNLSSVQFIEISSTAEAAKMASKSKQNGAIANELAAEVYNLNVLEQHIEDLETNLTRFLVISKDFSEKCENMKTSIMVFVKDEPGSLYNMLEIFKRRNINLTKIESRPSKQKAWEYIFFIDFKGYWKDKDAELAL